MHSLKAATGYVWLFKLKLNKFKIYSISYSSTTQYLFLSVFIVTQRKYLLIILDIYSCKAFCKNSWPSTSANTLPYHITIAENLVLKYLFLYHPSFQSPCLWIFETRVTLFFLWIMKSRVSKVRGFYVFKVQFFIPFLLHVSFHTIETNGLMRIDIPTNPSFIEILRLKFTNKWNF